MANFATWLRFITINIVMLVCIKHKIKYLKKVTFFVALQISYAKNILQLHCTNNFLYRNVACKFGGFNYQLILAVYDCFLFNMYSRAITSKIL